MFGDLFGSRSVPVVVVSSSTTTSSTISVTGPITGHYIFSGGQLIPFSTPAPTFLGQVVNGNFLPGPGFSALTGGPLAAVSPGQTSIQQIIQAVNGAGGTFTFLPGSNQATTPNTGTTFDLATGYLYTLPGTTTTTQPTILVELPNPAGGGAVGLTKMSDGNSPLPRDRVIFDYDYFNHAAVTTFSRDFLTGRTVDVNRFSPGFEKTFFDRRASVEVRVPFASTLSSDINADGPSNTSRAELGDVHLAFKALLWRGEAFNFAAGLGVDLPTADDTRVLTSDGTTLIRIRNDSVLLTPYFAYLLTPNDRLFFQNWFQVAFDANGNPVDANPDLTGLQNFGRINLQSLLEIDAQLGYWLYRPGDGAGRVRGLAPFVELHYNSTMGRSDVVQAGTFAVGIAGSHFDELNLAAGVIAQIGDNFLLSVGAVAPLKGHDDRSFDWQFGIRGSLLFGPTARDRSRATPVSSF
jgi:hypothetical protein